MWAASVVEVVPTLDGKFPGSRLAKGSGVEALLVKGAMRAFDFAVLLGLSYRNQLVAYAQVAQGLFKGVGLLHMWEEYKGELRTVVGLDFLDGEGEGEGPPDHVEEPDAGLWGELRTDVCYLKARTVVDGVVEVLPQGFWTTLQVQERQVLDVYLDPLAWDSHGVALRLLARP